jgi:2-polyprenyl-3-methyl-5-hydroxy-6-metoxy-1,4-benzoquinol methylase
MIYNRILGRREICEAMLGHPAAKMGISKWLGDIGKRFGFIYIKLFGYPPTTVSRILARKVLRALNKNGKGSVLDVGCSHGAFSFELARRGHSVVGIDINRESVEVGQKIQRCLDLKNLCFYHMDILSNQFPEKQFDVIMMFEALEHIKDDSKVICEFNRLLKDEGILMVSVPYAKSVEEYGEPVGACRAKDGTFVCIGEGGSHYRNGYNLEKMKSVLERNGFAITDWEYLCLPRFLESSILSFPVKYPLSLLVAKVSRNPVKLKVTAKKAPRRS